MRKIVVGVEDTEQSRQALRWAHTLAQALGAELEAVTVWLPMARYAWMGGGWVIPEDTWDTREDTGAVLEQVLREELGEDAAQVHCTVTTGNVVKALVEASKDAEMLVVGSRGHSPLLGTLLGSVSAPCAERAQCPVLVVHKKNAPPTIHADQRDETLQGLS